MQKRTELLNAKKICVHRILLLPLDLTIKRQHEEWEATKHFEGCGPLCLWRSRLESRKEEDKDALCEMPGKTFWLGDAKDFEAPIKPLALVQVMVFPSLQPLAARVFQQRKEKWYWGGGGAASSAFSTQEQAGRARHRGLTFMEGLGFHKALREDYCRPAIWPERCSQAD